MAHTTAIHLLPSNRTPLEQALSEAADFLPRVEHPADAMPGIKLRAAPDSFLPYLHAEYGLGPISRFHANPRELITKGIDWQRVRGTHSAVDKALEWVNYAGDIEIFPPRRRRWNLFMLALNKFRVNEEPDLNDIDDLAQLSVAVRSRYWRGFFGYDVRGVDYGYTKWGNTLWSQYSGARIRPNGAKWSFGRGNERAYTLTEAELTALGVWIEPSGGGPAALGWGNFTWDATTATWSGGATRETIMAAGVLGMRPWVVFYNAADQVIGYRRARVFRSVESNTLGQYQIGAVKYRPASAVTSFLYVEAMTDFGDGAGNACVKWGIVLNPTLSDPTKPGLAWANPGDLSGGTVIMPTTVPQFEFGRTVRERFKALLQFS